MNTAWLAAALVAAPCFSGPRFCLGPDCMNPPLNPITCNGDVVLSVSGLYWYSSMDGLEVALCNSIRVPVLNPTQSDISLFNRGVDTEFKTIQEEWDYGFKLGLGYAPCHDGWDLFGEWTRFTNHSHSTFSTTIHDNLSLLPLFSAFAPAQGNVLYARKIDANWNLELNRVDLTLGRDFWTGPRLSIRPYIGGSYLRIDQSLSLTHCGGSWSPRINPTQDPFTGLSKAKNDSYGAGALAGLDTTWHLLCGWALYGGASAGISYGRFNTSFDESLENVVSPQAKTKILDLESTVKAARPYLDGEIGVQWKWISCDGCYFVRLQLGWEQHFYFHQNQLWRIFRVADTPMVLPNNSGENVFVQRRGTLAIGGVVLNLAFGF